MWHRKKEKNNPKVLVLKMFCTVAVKPKSGPGDPRKINSLRTK
jgi:hypothetical protein